MARGWESKSVEAQQDDAVREQAERGAKPPTRAEREAGQQRRTLELSRARLLSDLEKATRPVQKQMLQLGLAAVESELARLTVPAQGAGTGPRPMSG
jgi:hypothetical protein